MIDLADAFVVAWLPGSEGSGVADVLVAKGNGKAGYDLLAVCHLRGRPMAARLQSPPQHALSAVLALAIRSKLA